MSKYRKVGGRVVHPDDLEDNQWYLLNGGNGFRCWLMYGGMHVCRSKVSNRSTLLIKWKDSSQRRLEIPWKKIVSLYSEWSR